jgi:hypothetical protein
VGEYLVGVASGLIFLGAFAHAWPGWWALRGALGPGTDPAILGAVGIGWHFGSVSMATFGLLGLLSAAQMRKGQAGARWTPALIGTAYVLFGIGALLSIGPSLHFVVFIVLGCLLAAGALLSSSGAR